MSQIIINGINNLEEILKGYNSKKFLLVRDGSFDFLSIKGYFDGIKTDFAVFDGFTPNPLYEDVCKGVEVYKNENCDVIVAVGGGSSLDVAKCIKLYAKMDPKINYLKQECFDSQIPLIAIPTTAGTGSESTRYAVIYFEGKKQSVAHQSIIPSYALLEPAVLKTLPIYQKKCTMLDALCQGIESYWSVNSTDESKGYAREAIKLILEYKDEYLSENTPVSAEKIMLAANLSGRAINITQTTAAHAFSYKITSLYGKPHGHAVAVCLPEIWKFMINNYHKCVDKRGEERVKETFEEIALLFGEKSVEGAIKTFENMLLDMDISKPTSTSKREDVDLLAKSVNPVRLKNNPIMPNEEDIITIYNSIIR